MVTGVDYRPAPLAAAQNGVTVVQSGANFALKRIGQLRKRSRTIVHKRLDGKVAIVTGASKGIGKAIAKLYAQEGAKVLAVFHSDSASAARAAKEISEAGGEVALFQGDVSKRADTQKMAEKAVALYGRLDILCCNAGIYPGASIEDMTEEDWDRVQAVNLKGAFLGVKACIGPMKARNYGRIVVISSTTGPRTGIPGYSHYGASKGGMEGFIRCACIELGPHNITINAVEPGMTMTEGLRSTIDEAGFGDAAIKEVANEIPLKRLADPIDIAYAALFLASDESRYITGQALTVDGGLVLPELPLRLFG